MLGSYLAKRAASVWLGAVWGRSASYADHRQDHLSLRVSVMAAVGGSGNSRHPGPQLSARASETPAPGRSHTSEASKLPRSGRLTVSDRT